MSKHALRVGAPYNPGRRRWPEGVNYNFRGGDHELLLILDSPSKKEIAGVASGAGDLALLVELPIILLLYRSGDQGSAIPWSDAPYTWHRVPAHERPLPGDEAQATIRIVLVDASSGIVRALRLVLLPEGFTRALHQAIRDQAGAPWDERAFDRSLERLYGRLDSASLARGASHLTTIPAKSGETREA